MFLSGKGRFGRDFPSSQGIYLWWFYTGPQKMKTCIVFPKVLDVVYWAETLWGHLLNFKEHVWFFTTWEMHLKVNSIHRQRQIGRWFYADASQDGAASTSVSSAPLHKLDQTMGFYFLNRPVSCDDDSWLARTKFVHPLLCWRLKRGTVLSTWWIVV